jgi:hypothetical protein
MPACDQCGNAYDKSFQVIMDGIPYTFDRFECAIHRLAPLCAHCQCRILGHGMESEGQLFCCAHCARHYGVKDVADRAEPGDPMVKTMD